MPGSMRPGLRGWVTLAVLAVFAVVPVLASAFDVPFYTDVANRILVLAIAAVSLNLILGYGGMISFGHAAYLGLGAYCVGIPAYYEIYSGFVHLPLALVVGAAFALVTGAISLRTRGVYFIMITLAFAQMAYFTFISIEEYGGDDGLVIELRSELAPLVDLEDGTALYYVSFASLLVCLYVVRRLVRSRFGMVIEGARHNERRLQSVGVDPYRYRLVCYVISGAMCTYAGALLGNFTSFISPEMMDWTRSGELIFMVVLGGAGSLFGPVLGATTFLLLEEILPWVMDGTLGHGSGIYWHLPFGVILILVVVFARGGIDGALGVRREDS